MKRNLMLVAFCLIFALLLCGCGSSTGTIAPAETSVPAETEAPAAETTAPVESTAPEESAAPVASLPDAGLHHDESTDNTAERRFELAKTFIDKPLSELQAEIGEPKDSAYVSSCLIPGGQDGELHYDGFTVYTVQTADSETVLDVIAD